ncbi:nidogen-1 isoform X2 [Rhinatrema bivittatum]|uniref:nidogen-1 isoform X2 n=1 Tax=Rhinatrema bivittatum TaxID=194408 RepID=UPI001129172F|nr:nidogen-1 isoform X2 [Rhinatrema bivittatum]
MARAPPPPRSRLPLLLLLCLTAAPARSLLSRRQLLPYGAPRGDRRLEPGDDSASPRLQLALPLHFYGGSVPALYIGTNGIIATSEPSQEDDYLATFPPTFGVLAPFMVDLDTSDGYSEVFYREDSSPEILQLAAEHINRGFPLDDFYPDNAVIITWENVAAYREQRGDSISENKRNTFQAVLASDESTSYAIFLYPGDGLQFYGMQSKKSYSNNERIFAKVGFGKGTEKFLFWNQQGAFNVFASDEQSLRNLVRSSNSGKQGVWVFDIGSSSNKVLAAQIDSTFEEDTEGVDQPSTHSDSVYNEEYQIVATPSPDAIDEGQQEIAFEVASNKEDQQYVVHHNPQPDAAGESQYNVHHRTTLTDLSPEDPHIDQDKNLTPLGIQPGPFQVPQFPQQNPQVVVVDEEFDNTGIVFHYNTGNQQTCASNRHRCSVYAVCRDYSTGFCCRCLPGYYGNGRQCVEEGTPQRVNGKVKGRLFVGNTAVPVVFENIDLHSYVVVNDGRAYTAISTISESLGYSLLPLASVGGVIGWMFALEQPQYKNGFSITGGEFTRQAEVTFLPGNERLVIKQQFTGIDEHGHLTISTELEGRVPKIPFGSTVQLEPYTELYHSSSSVITSSSAREYTVEFPEGNSQTYTYQWKQTMSFQECIYDTTQNTIPATQQLSVDRIFVLYNKEEQILRYAMTNSIGPISDGSAETNRNPCYTGTHGCDTNAACRPGQGNQFTCECTAGFRGNGITCFDVDECREQPAICGDHATCNNQPGTFRCECFDGYQFSEDGRTCIGIERPINHCVTGTHSCDIPERARCIYTGSSSYICACLSGFTGDGRSCEEPEKTKCQRHRESALGFGDPGLPRGPRPVGQFVPTCDEYGEYTPVQCHASTGQCWCVNREGNEIDGTRKGPGIRPPCLDTVTHPPPVGPTVRPSLVPLPPGTHLIFAQSGKLEHVPLERESMKKTVAKTLLHVPDKVIIGVAYDCVDKMVYWTDISGPSVSRANLQGGEPTAIIKTGLGSPEGIAVDHLGRNIFWTDSQLDRIEVAKLDGSQRLVLFDTELVNPRGIVADPMKGKLYWTDWNRNAPKIEMSHLDGTNRRILVKDELELPNGLTIDPYSSMLCWADAGTKKLECLNPSHPVRRKILEGIQYPFGVTSYGKNLYYTDWRRDAVVAVDRTISKENDDFQPHKRSRLYGITTAYSQCPPGHSYCSVNNGGCSHLCLATPGGRSCRCPENTIGVDCTERN